MGGNTCNAFAGATTEICDDKDNNCNGKIDESPLHSGNLLCNIIIKNMVIYQNAKVSDSRLAAYEPGRLPMIAAFI